MTLTENRPVVEVERPAPAPTPPPAKNLAKALAAYQLGPGWPLIGLLGFYPLWWVLGLGVLIFPIAAVPMAVSLWRRHRAGLPVRMPPAFGLWLIFCLVLVAGMAALDAEPAETVAGGFNGRMPAVAFRVVQYLSLTILLVYAGNLSLRALPQRRLIGLLAWLFIVTVLGGLLGTFAGHLELTSPVEMLLPSGMRNKGFIKSLVHPYAAQIMDLIGDPQPRPAAPWGYTNTWGNNYCLLVGWFALLIRKPWGWAVLAVSLIPVVHSLNRGLWIGLAVMLGYLVVRQVLAGKFKVLLFAALAVGALALTLATTPLAGVIERRLDNGKSNGVRLYLTERAISGFQESPILGFGSTRNTVGGRQSIAVGESPATSGECERCGNFTIGGNGQLWQLLFAHGLIGTVAYFGFFGYGLWRFRRDRSPIGLAGSAALVGSFAAALWYNSLVTPLAFAFLAYVLLWRNSLTPPTVESGVSTRVRSPFESG